MNRSNPQNISAGSLRLAALVVLVFSFGCATPRTDRFPSGPESVEDAPVALTDEDRELTDEEREIHLQSFDYVWETVRDKHWDAELNGLDWEAVRAETRPKVENAKTEREIRRLTMSMLHRLGQSHFGIIPRRYYDDIDSESDDAKADEGSDAHKGGSSGDAGGDASATADADRTASSDPDSALGEPGESGMTIRVLSGRALVTEIWDGYPARELGVTSGWEVLKIGNLVVSKAIERLEETEGSRDTAMLSRMLMGRLSKDQGETVTTVFRDASGKETTLDVPMGPVRGVTTSFGNMPSFTVWFEENTRGDSGEISYFRFNMFMNPMMIMPGVERVMKASFEQEGVIIDLRGNPGGIGALAMGVAGWFIDEKSLHLGTMIMRTTELKFVVSPRSRTFSGPVAILVDGLTGSTSEIFSGGMQDLGRARVFGRKTMGAALPSMIERLPNGDGFQYAISNYISSGGEPLEGEGVTPDEEIIPTRDELLMGKDPVVDAAIAWIKTQS